MANANNIERRNRGGRSLNPWLSCSGKKCHPSRTLWKRSSGYVGCTVGVCYLNYFFLKKVAGKSVVTYSLKSFSFSFEVAVLYVFFFQFFFRNAVALSFFVASASYFYKLFSTCSLSLPFLVFFPPF